MLKSLDLAGFKSFARPTHLEFPPGITAIVGPNGSGKSNVVDAIRWCLGEQSARELRGSRAEDVIYAGRKRSLGVADVAMLLAETAGADIEIGRRLFRSGESEYLVNRERARLRDVVIALAGAGIDAGRHVVVNQGMADALLSAGPLERRALLEQAAGLSRYREQRDEARRKIAATQSSIETIALVLAEMEPRLALLRRQARAVSERKQNADRLAQRLRLWYASRWASAVDAVRKARDEKRRTQDDLKRSRSDLSEMETKVEELLNEERRLVRQREIAVAGLHKSERECDELRRTRDALDQRIVDLSDRLDDARAREATLEDAIERGRAERADAQSALETIELEIGVWIEQRETSCLSVARLEEASSRAEAAATSAATELNRLVKRAAAASDAHRSALQTLESRIADRTRLTDHLTGVDARRGELEAELADVSERLRALEEDSTEAECRVAALQRDRDECMGRMRRIDGIRRRLDVQVGRSCGAIETARSRCRAAAGAVNSDLLGAIKVPKGWEKAIAAALGDLARPGVLELAVVDLVNVSCWRDTLGLEGTWADDLVMGAPPGLFAATLLVETEAAARSLWAAVAERPAHLIGSPPLRIVARSGFVCEASGTRMPGGAVAAEEYLLDASEIERRKARVANLERRIHSLMAHGQKVARRLAATERDLHNAEQDMRDARELLSEASGAKRGLVRQVSESADDARSARAALQPLDEDITLLTNRAGEAERAARALAADEIAFRTALDDASQVADTARHRLDQARREHESHGQALAIAQERRIYRQKERDSADEMLSRLQAELVQTVDGIPSLQIQVERARSDREQVAASQAAIGVRARDQRARIDALPRVLDTDRPDPRNLRNQVVQATSRSERAVAQLERCQDEAMRLQAEMQLDLGIEPDKLPAPGDDIPEDVEIRRLKSRVAGQAMLDDSVVAEYDELNERYTYLRHHLDDLDRALGGLNEILAVSDREMDMRFAAAFGAVDAEFGRVFEIMLRGGMGRLASSNDGGVDVIAELPGKRARSTTAYSGGERALVASALLFAVLKIRPTPFCILDEVDAALDESNVDRYLAVLRDISQSTQTIVVTHNRATMTAADVLYGMTMDGEGGTNVLSLNLQTYSAS